MFKRCALVAVAVVLQACAIAPDETTGELDPAYRSPTAVYAPPPAAAGAIFNPAGNYDLFMDLRARAVGDILTILLVERTDASKESSTSTSRGASTDTGFPIIAGVPITHNGDQILNNEMSSDTTFDG